MTWRRWRGSVLVRGPRALKHLVLAVALGGVGLVAALGADLARWSLRVEDGGFDGRRQGGSLVICGGGRLTEEVRDQFVERAGGRKARIVVIPTATARADDPEVSRFLDVWKSCGVASAVLLHTRSRTRANDPEFVRPLREATGVWIGGGSQSWLTATYEGTEVERQLRGVLERGGVVGGTSAGAAVMTRVMIANGRRHAVVGQGFDLFPGAVVDQHFLRRNRAHRLLGVLAGRPDLIGFGIDERTALVVGVRDRSLRVIGDSYVIACVPATAHDPARLEVLKPGDLTDLDALRRPDVRITSTIDLDDELSSSPGR